MKGFPSLVHGLKLDLGLIKEKRNVKLIRIT